MIEFAMLNLEKGRVKPFSVTNNSVGLQPTAARNVGAAIVAHVARSGRSRINAVICNWKGL